MSQRECAGFNWPPLSIPAQEPVSISPETVSRAGPQIAAKSCNRCCTFDPSGRVVLIADSGLPLRSLLCDVGVGQPDSTAAWFSVMLGVLKFSEGLRTASVLVVVGHPVSIAKSFRLDPCLVSPMARAA